MDLTTIRGINTFIQNSMPTSPQTGDVWAKPGYSRKLIWGKDGWSRDMWQNVVSNIYWGPGCEYGYICGGYDGNYFSTIDRITFPFDSGTASHVGNLSGTRYIEMGCNSSNYGYICGGSNGNYLSTINRITFPFDSGTASHVGNLSGIRDASSACNSSNYGYICGGYNTANNLSTVDRITFPFDSGTASQVGNLSGTRRLSASCNSSNYGYICGGSFEHNGAHFSTIDRITFPFDSGTASHVGNLSESKYISSSCDGTDFVTLFT